MSGAGVAAVSNRERRALKASCPRGYSSVMDDDVIEAFKRQNDRRVLVLAFLAALAAGGVIGLLHRQAYSEWNARDPNGWAYFAVPFAICMAIGALAYSYLRIRGARSETSDLNLSNHWDAFGRIVAGIGLIAISVWFRHDTIATWLPLLAGVALLLTLPPLSLSLGDQIQFRTVFRSRTRDWSELRAARLERRWHRFVPHTYLVLEFTRGRNIEMWSTFRANTAFVFQRIASYRPDLAA